MYEEGITRMENLLIAMQHMWMRRVLYFLSSLRIISFAEIWLHVALITPLAQ